MTHPWTRTVVATVLFVVLGLIASGCQHPIRITNEQIGDVNLPRELVKANLPEYVIEPPDLLLIDAISIIPKPPYRISPGDVLFIRVPEALKAEPISGTYPVEPDGTVALGASYGTVNVTGLTIPQAKEALEKHLGKILKDPSVFVALGQSKAMQQIQGQHLVTPDGYVRLGLYGNVNVTGMTLSQAKQAIEQHLSRYLLNPEVSVDVLAYNSKLLYIIFDGGGSGQQILRLPVTGNDTVLDALAQAGGLTAVSSLHQIWVARPAPANSPCDQILPVDWNAITQRGRTETNYQLLPGDRIYVKANPLVTLDTFLARAISPVERIFGIILLGNSTIQTIKNQGGGGGFGNQGFANPGIFP